MLLVFDTTLINLNRRLWPPFLFLSLRLHQKDCSEIACLHHYSAGMKQLKQACNSFKESNSSAQSNVRCPFSGVTFRAFVRKRKHLAGKTNQNIKVQCKQVT
jgi:hypothetical protein